MITLSGDDCETLAATLEQSGSLVDAAMLPSELLDQLLLGGFLVPPDRARNELAAIKERFLGARAKTPAVLTITTTMDCNLGCYYCYEDRQTFELAGDQVSQILARLKADVVDQGRSRLHVDWYGGEPLLNFEFLETASAAIQSFCSDHGVTYSASIISNGTLWPDDPVDFVKRHKIRQVQISFDGMRAHHDKRRRIRSGYTHRNNRIFLSSFDAAVNLVDQLAGEIQVDLRFNIDRKNSSDLMPFIEMADERGWFAGPKPAVFQPARLAAYTDSSAFMRNAELSLEEYDALREQVRNKMDGIGKVEESEVPDGYPYPKTSVCAALGNSSSVIGADGKIYRCGLQVGETDREVGSLDNQMSENAKDSAWWEAFDPTTLPNCSKCSFLPICWGGCPKKHLDRDMHALEEQSLYWRSNLPRIIAEKAGLSEDYHPQSFSEAQQFRHN